MNKLDTLEEKFQLNDDNIIKYINKKNHKHRLSNVSPSNLNFTDDESYFITYPSKSYIDIESIKNRINDLNNVLIASDKDKFKETLNNTIIQLKNIGTVNIQRPLLIKITDKLKELYINVSNDNYNDYHKNVLEIKDILQMV